jgi:hypothetical protein
MSADLSLLQYDPKKDPNSGLESLLSRPYCSGSYAVGVQKLSQQFMAELMTLAGSVRFDPNYGCSFINDIRSCNATALVDIRRSLTSNVNTVTANRRRRETGDEPLDELLDRVEITGLDQYLDQVIVSLRVYSEAGSQTAVQLPLDLLN